PVRIGTYSEPRTPPAFTRRRGPVRLELGPGQVPGKLRGRGQVVVGGRPAQAVERPEEDRPDAGLVAPELQMRLSGSLPRLGPGSGRLHQVQEWSAEGPQARLPAVQKRSRCKDSFRFSTGAVRCAGKTVTYPGSAPSPPTSPPANSPAGWTM